MSQQSNRPISPSVSASANSGPKRSTDRWRKCFATFNNFQNYPGAIAHLKRYLENDTSIKFTKISGIAMQPERAPTTGTPHLQMYIEFTPGSQLSSRQIHEIPGLRHVAIKPAPRSVKRCLEYVSKNYTRMDNYPALTGKMGVFRGQAKAKSRKEIFDKIREGSMTLKQVYAADPDLYIRNSSGIAKAIGLHLKDRTFITNGIIYFGPTGCGKTIKAWAENPKAYPFCWPKGSKLWMDKYSGCVETGKSHDVMICDEFRSNRLSLTRMLDFVGNSKPLPCQTKGGWTTFNSHTMIITTNQEPMDWYPNLSKGAFSMMRRRLLQHCEIWDFSRPDLPHWAIDYSGPKIPLKQLLSEIICTKRTSEVLRTEKEPGHLGASRCRYRSARRNNREHDYNFGNRYTTADLAEQVQRSRQALRTRLTGKKRNREADNEGPPRKIRPPTTSNPYTSYGQNTGGTTLEIDEELSD